MARVLTFCIKQNTLSIKPVTTFSKYFLCNISTSVPKLTSALSSSGGSNDFFGIDEFENESVTVRDITEDSRISMEHIYKSPEAAKKNMDKIIGTPYGFIRRDQDNVTVSKRQLRKLKLEENTIHKTIRDNMITADKQNTRMEENKYSVCEENCKDNYFDELLLKDYENRRESSGDAIESQIQHCVVPTVDTLCGSQMNFVDEQYFGKTQTQSINEGRIEYGMINEEYLDVKNIGKTWNENYSVNENDLSELDFIDQQYFNESNMEIRNSVKFGSEYDSSKAKEYTKIEKMQSHLNDYAATINDCSNSEILNDNKIQNDLSEKNKSFRHVYKDDIPKQIDRDEEPIIISSQQNVEKRRTKDKNQLLAQNKQSFHSSDADICESKTAFDYVMKIRAEKASKHNVEVKDVVYAPGKGEHSDSKGFRVMRDHIIDFSKLPRSEIVDVLQEAIIYDQHDILAISKPYGLSSHGGPGVVASIGQLLPDLGDRIDQFGQTRLHLVHRLDKETTGVMVLAKTVEMASRLRAMFLSRSVVKKYWVITKDVPHPSQGTIDIPMRESKVGSGYRMTVQPDYSPHTGRAVRRRARANPAITKYTVLDSTSRAALIECQPQTGKKHQIRVHLAAGLNTPILGDHKYSHFMKLVPQKLHPEMLRSLGVRQAKVRHIPMHLHAQSLILPQFIDGRNINITVKPPRYFLKNMQRLRLKHPFSR